MQDGIIVTDMKPTIDRIVKASFLPLSIVIVGVGSADFSAMVCSYLSCFDINGSITDNIATCSTMTSILILIWPFLFVLRKSFDIITHMHT